MFESVAVLSRQWGLFALRGVLAILLGLCAFFSPAVALSALILFVGAYLIVDGVFTMGAALAAIVKNRERWWLLLLEGVVSVVIGVLILKRPILSALVFVYFVAGWAIITGILELAAAYYLRRILSGDWLLTFTGIVSLALGFLLIAVRPGTALLVYTCMLGGYALAFGVSMLGLASRLHALARPINRGSVPQS